MNKSMNEPIAPIDQTISLVEPDSPALANLFDDSFTETCCLRHDGWDGQKMARFCEVLAETGIVIDACRAARMSAKSAYALRHRDPLFARAWEAALSMARARLADELLARSLRGSVEQIIRDGGVVGERHHYDNKLALAVLRRLDRRAELGATFRTLPAREVPSPAPAVSGEWQPLLDAMSQERSVDVARLLTPMPMDEPATGMSKGDKGNEGNDPPIEDWESDDFDHPRIWRTWDTREWRTDYPPPPGFDGFEQGDWEDQGYCRALTDEELAALIAAGIADPDELEHEVSLEQDEAERDAFFKSLAAGAASQPPEVQNRIGQEHDEAGDDGHQHPRGEIVDRSEAEEGLEQHQGDAEADKTVGEEEGETGHHPPLRPAIDPAAAEGIVQGVGADEADRGRGQLGHAAPFDQDPQQAEAQQEDENADRRVARQQDGGVARP